MRSYLKAKLLLFKNIILKKRSIISDKSIKEFSILKKISKKKDLRLIDITQTKEKILKKNLNLSEFQLKNLSMAVEAAKLCNLKEIGILNILNKVKDVDGRLELVRNFPDGIKVYVDFAHTPDALLKSLKALGGTNISLVFGCGGNRDHKKRPLMGKIASSYCKKFMLLMTTQEMKNPRR